MIKEFEKHNGNWDLLLPTSKGENSRTGWFRDGDLRDSFRSFDEGIIKILTTYERLTDLLFFLHAVVAELVF